MNEAIVVAIVALVSTIIGAIVGAVTTYTLAVRRERADREIEDRKHAVEVKRAARLLGVHLVWVRTAANMWTMEKEKRKFHATVPRFSLSAEARQTYLGAIAADLSDDDWSSVIAAFQAADSFEMLRDQARDQNIAISDAVAETVVPLITQIDTGHRDLIRCYLVPEIAGK